MRVIDGGCTRSCAASVPTVHSPSRKSTPSALSAATLSGLSGCRSLRSRRDNRITESRSSLASPESVREALCTVGVMSLA